MSDDDLSDLVPPSDPSASGAENAPDAPADAGSPAADVPLEEMQAPEKSAPEAMTEKTVADLEAIFDVPVRVSVILGRAKIPVADLINMDEGTVVELDRQVGEAIEVFVNDRLIARGEIVLVENRLGVTMTEIIKAA